MSEIEKKLYDHFTRPYAAGELQAVSQRIELINEAQGGMNARLEARIAALEQENAFLKGRQQAILDNLSVVNENLRNINAQAEKERAEAELELDYFDFENYFRGPREKIKESQAGYLHYYQGHDNVLDIGSGRGEFLEVLKAGGVEATGIDLNEDFVRYCNEELGLSVLCGDGIAYLRDQAESSVGGIFASQVIEHLTPAQLIQFLRLAYQKLEKDAYIILETPNPMSLAVFTHAFYIDPSHVKPVHPLTVKYIMERAGYREIEIIFTPGSRLEGGLPALKGEGIENAEAFNRAVAELNDVIYGSQDYAVIARK